MCSSSPVQLYRLTWWSRYSQEPRIDLPGPQMNSEKVNSDLSPESERQSEGSKRMSDPLWKRVALWFCGLSELTSNSELPVTENNTLNSIKESPLWRGVCNINALLLLTVNVFLWGYFA